MGLVNLIVEAEEKSEWARRASGLPSLQLSPRELCDLELLATGAFSPLDRFMRKADVARFPAPVVLTTSDANVVAAKEIALRSAHNNLLAWMAVEEVYDWEGRHALSGELRVIELPRHPDFPALRRTPAEVRALIGENAVAYMPRGPIHRAEEEMLRRAAEEAGGALLLLPTVGAVRPGDMAHYTRVRTYQALGMALNLVPLDAEREGLQELVARNYGARELLPYRAPAALLSEREYFDRGESLPEWYTRREIAEILAEAHPPKNRQGFCIWFTGLPSSGKSTVAEALITLLMEHGRQVTMLDGDVVRTHLSKGLSFSREDRDTNILRVGFVAAEIVRHHGAVICAAVSPYRKTRDEVRGMMEHFVEVYIDTSAEECERRDVKGFYAQAREGKIKGFTGVDDPYEAPLAPEIRLSTTGVTAAQNAARIVEYLAGRGLLGR